MTRQERNKKRLIRELESNPIIERACKKVGVARSTYYRWCESDTSFKRQSERAQVIGRGKLNDFAESKLLENISKNQYQSIALWLRHNTVRYHPPSSQDIVYQLEHLKKIVWTRTEAMNTMISRIGMERFEKLMDKDYEKAINEIDKAYEEDQIDRGYRKPGYRAWEPHLKYPDETGFDKEDI